jgi:general secretion pathway protein B
MSYILEALRRAETERERKRRVPSLHAQPVPVLSPEEPGARRSKAWLWVVVGVSAGVLLPLLWRSWAPDPAAEDAAGGRSAVAGSVTPQAGAAAADAPPPAPAVTTPEPPVANPAATAAAAAPERPRATPTTHAAPRTPAAAKAGAGTPTERATHAPNVTAAATAEARSSPTANPVPAAAVASAPEPRLRTLAELPEEVRRGVPSLAFGGSVYSEIAAQRIVIFNGQVLREGDAVTDELLLEQIRPHSAVMRIRGQRFEVAF